MRVAFIAPLPFTTLSGGYAYDRRMIAGLRAAGHAVDAIELSGDHPLTDTEARNAATRAWAALAADAHPVIDGLALPAFADLAEQLAARGAVGLIHHPTALETGFTEEQRETLRAAERRLMPHAEPGDRHQRADRGAPRRRFRRRRATASSWSCRAPTTRRAAPVRPTRMQHPLGRDTGAAQGP